MKKKSLLYIKTSDFKQIDIQTECSKIYNISYLEDTEVDCSSENGYYQYEDNKYTNKPKYDDKYSSYNIFNVNEKKFLPFLKSKYIFYEINREY